MPDPAIIPTTFVPPFQIVFFPPTCSNSKKGRTSARACVGVSRQAEQTSKGIIVAHGTLILDRSAIVRGENHKRVRQMLLDGLRDVANCLQAITMRMALSL